MLLLKRIMSLPSATFIETSPEEKGFAEYFQMHIAPIIEDLQLQRTGIRSDFWQIIKVVGTVVLSAILIILLTAYLAKLNGDIIWGLIILVLLGFFGWLNNFVKSKDMVNSVLIPLIGKFYGECYDDGKKYETSAARINIARQLKALNFLPPFTNSYYKEFYVGKLEGIEFSFWKMLLVDVKNKVFDGIVFDYKIKSEFCGHTRIINNWTNLFSIFRQGFEEKQHIHLQDPKWEKTFKVYSDNEMEANKLLIPELINHLMKLLEIYPGKLSASFKDNRAIIAISTFNSIYGNDLPSLLNGNYIENIRKVLHQFYELREIARILKN